MVATEALGVGYVALFAASGAITAMIGAWVYATVRVDGWRTFTVLMAVDTLWAWTAAVGIVLPGRTTQYVVTVVNAVFGTTAVVSWLLFTRQYTGRSLSLASPPVASLFAAYVLLLGVVLTEPVHGAYWSDLVYHQTPFPFVETEPGPLNLVALVFVFSLLGLSLYYLGDLYLRSDHRSNAPVALLIVGTVLSFLPNVASQIGLVPVPGYDHTPLGIAMFILCATYGIFRLGIFEIAPVAREELVTQVDDALFVLDAAGRLVDCNPATADIVPGIDETAVGEPIDSVAPDLADRLSLTADPAAGTTEEFSVVRADGRYHYSVRVSPITDEGAVVAYSVVLRDITDLVESNRELERQNQQLDDFAESITHDIRNPLQVATGNVEALSRRLDAIETRVTDESVREAIADARESVAHTESALGQLQTTADELRYLAEHGQSVQTTEPVAFETAVTSAWEHLETGDNALVTVDTGTIEADRQRFLLVLENLLRYCVERDDDPVTVEAALTDDGFVLRDDGSTIPESDRDSLFEFGYTPTSSASRLGLRIVRTVVGSHGWSINLDASYEGGACFVVADAITTLESEDRAADVREG
jgi:PAS domain S-box-containing protein